jgi:ribonuclease HI
MTSRAPHYLLFSEAARGSRRRGPGGGQWRFLLQSVENESRFEAHDREPRMSSDRLELLAVVRGLEALDQPSRVTLVTPSQYVSRGLRFGMDEWRENRWRWENHGRMVPVKDNDLWERVDQAMKYHDVDCRTWRFDSAHTDLTGPRDAAGGRPTTGKSQGSGVKRAARRAGKWIGRWFSSSPSA